MSQRGVVASWVGGGHPGTPNKRRHEESPRPKASPMNASPSRNTRHSKRRKTDDGFPSPPYTDLGASAEPVGGGDAVRRAKPAKFMYKSERKTSFLSPTKPPKPDDTFAPRNGVFAPAQARLAHCLLSKAKRWCMYEWFYSPIDTGFFAHNGFTAAMESTGVPTVTHLTRAEWSRLRWHLGRSRRFSNKFVAEERTKLRQYRDVVRRKQQNQSLDDQQKKEMSDLPPVTKVPAILQTGDRVYAVHPTFFHVFLGQVLSYDVNKYMYFVRFDHSNLGERWVEDVQVMPYNMGASASKRKRTPPRSVSMAPSPSSHGIPMHQANGMQYMVAHAPISMGYGAGHAMQQQQYHHSAGSFSSLGPPKGPGSQLIGSMPSDMMRDVDTRNLASLQMHIARKWELLELVHAMNEQASQAARHAEPFNQHFREAYAQYIVMLRSLNEVIKDKLTRLHNEIRRHPETPGDTAPSQALLAEDASLATSGSKAKTAMPSYVNWITASKNVIKKSQDRVQPPAGVISSKSHDVMMHCMALLLVLKKSASNNQHGSEVRQAITTALDRLQPAEGSRETARYAEVKHTVNQLIDIVASAKTSQ